MPATLRYLLIFILLGLPSASQAGVLVNDLGDHPLLLSVDSTTISEWHSKYKENENQANIEADDFVKLQETLRMNVGWERWEAGFRLDALYYPDPLEVRTVAPQGSTLPSQTYGYSEDAVRLEKIYGTYRDDNVTVTLGDFTQTLGRGIALSITRRAEDFYDNSLRGARIAFRGDATRATGFAGLTNTLNTDLYTEKVNSDPNDLIGGFEIAQRFADVFTLEMHAVGTQHGATLSQAERRFLTEDKTLIWGASLELTDIAQLLSLYVEGDYMMRSGRKIDIEDARHIRPTQADGYAVYASLDLYYENFTFLGEYKHYDTFQFRRTKNPIDLQGRDAPGGTTFTDDIWYHDPPNLEKEDMELHLNEGTAQGFRLRADYLFDSIGMQPYVNYYFSINRSEKLEPSQGGFGENVSKGYRIHHAYGGLTQFIGAVELIAEGGFRDEYHAENSVEYQEIIHAKLALKAPLAENHGLEAEAIYRRKDEQSAPVRLTDEVETTLSYTYKGRYSFAFLYTYQSIDVPDTSGDDTQDHYFAGEIKARFTDWAELSVFGGQVKSGYRCFGGVCRQIPKFEGVKGKLVLRY